MPGRTRLAGVRLADWQTFRLAGSRLAGELTVSGSASQRSRSYRPALVSDRNVANAARLTT